MLKTNLKTFHGNTAVLGLQGRLVFGETGALRDAVRGLIGSDYRCVVIDLTQVNKIDCAGLGELVRYYTEARDAGTFLALSNLNRCIRDVLVITKLVTVFPIIDSNSFEKAA